MTRGWWLGTVFLAAGCGDTASNATADSDTTGSSDFDTGVAGSTSGSTTAGIITLDPTGRTGAGGSGSVEVEGDGSGCGNSSHSSGPDDSCAAVLCPLLPYDELHPDAPASSPCTFALPAPPFGEPVDPGQVNVLLERPDGTVEALFYTDDSNECSPWAWYYDYPDAPTSIVLCAELCRAVHSEPVPELMVGYGCVTRPL